MFLRRPPPLRLLSTCPPSPLRIEVVGAGSAGLLVGAALHLLPSDAADFPFSTRLLLRPERHAREAPTGLLPVDLIRREGPTWRHTPAQISASSVASPRDAAEDGARVLLLLTKAPDAREALADALRNGPAPAFAAVLSNGALAAADELRGLLPARCGLVLGCVTHGAYRTPRFRGGGCRVDSPRSNAVVHAGVGAVSLSPLLEGSKTALPGRLAHLLSRAGLGGAVVSAEEMYAELWRKLAANCVINPATALLRCRNGELLSLFDGEGDAVPAPGSGWGGAIRSRPVGRRILQGALEEAVAVGRADLARRGEGKGLSLAASEGYVRDLLQATKDNVSSMRQDVERAAEGGGRARTEVGYLNGYVVRCGRRYGVPTPCNAQLVKWIEELCADIARGDVGS